MMFGVIFPLNPLQPKYPKGIDCTKF
jgi:hypothetical protein